jgi:hypothetical protein
MLSSEAAMLKDNTHIIREVLRGQVDDRDKIRAVGPNPVAVTACGMILSVRDRQYITRLSDDSPLLLCTECLASLLLIE